MLKNSGMPLPIELLKGSLKDFGKCFGRANLSKLTFNSRNHVSNTSFSSSNSPRFKRTRTISCIETTGVQTNWRTRSSNSISESEKQSHNPQVDEIKKEVRALKYKQLKSVYCVRSWYICTFSARSGPIVCATPIL